MLLTLTLAAVLGGPTVNFFTPITQAAQQQSSSGDQKPAADQKPPDVQKPDEQKAEAKEPPTPPHTGLRALFANLVEDVKHVPAKQNLYLAMIGGGLAGAAHPFDQDFN